MNITPNNTRYIPFTQQRWCCVPACISMIMYRHNIPLIPQELLGYHLGLILPKDELRYFWNARTGKKPLAGYGTRVNESKYNPNKIFPKLGIPLKMIFHPIDKFTTLGEYKNYLSLVEKEDKDVVACFDWGALVNQDYHGGHLTVVDRANINKNEIRLIDPEYKATKWLTVKISKLKKAMEYHGSDRSGGFWEFVQTKK